MNILANETLIEKANGAFGRPYYLLSVAAAEVPAGAGTRWQNECYRVAYTIQGVRNSRAFKSYAEAKADFDRVTMPIVAIDA